MKPKEHFRKNLKKLIKSKGYRGNEAFGKSVGLSKEKIQRFSDAQGTGLIDLDDADKIAVGLETTLGYMCGNVYTDYMLTNTRKMYVEAVENLEHVAVMKGFLESREKSLVKNIAYLEEILNKVDGLSKK